jgi:hypothetical protein
MILRGLPSMAARRIADTTCTVTYNLATPLDDGSATIIPMDPMDLTLKASIQALQPIEVQRLLEAGIEVVNAVSILMSEAWEERPEKLVANGRSWRILSWSFVPAYDNESGNPIGTVVAVCDEIRVTPVAL